MLKCAACDKDATKQVIFTISIPGTPNEPVPVCAEHAEKIIDVEPLRVET